MSWWRTVLGQGDRPEKFYDPFKGNVVAGDQAGRDIVKQTIVGNGNVQSTSHVSSVDGNSVTTSGDGIKIMNRNGHITIKGPVKSLKVNERVYDFPYNKS